MNMTSNLTKEDILEVLNATDSEIIKFMSETVKYRENHLITYSKNVFIPLTEIYRMIADIVISRKIRMTLKQSFLKAKRKCWKP